VTLLGFAAVRIGLILDGLSRQRRGYNAEQIGGRAGTWTGLPNDAIPLIRKLMPASTPVISPSRLLISAIAVSWNPAMSPVYAGDQLGFQPSSAPIGHGHVMNR